MTFLLIKQKISRVVFSSLVYTLGCVGFVGVANADKDTVLPPGMTKTKKEVKREKISKEKSELPSGFRVIPSPSYSVKSTAESNIKQVTEILEQQRKKEAKNYRPGSEPGNNGGLEASIGVRKDARTMTLSIPAPRGQITDRNGKPFAQTKVVWYPALKFGQFEKDDRAYVISWARKRIAQANEIFKINWKVSDEQLWQQYKYRRWLAMPYVHVVNEASKNKLEKKLMSGLILQAVYLRYYPQKRVAAHIIGYVGNSGKLEKGPINYGDPIFPYSEGRAGLEKIFNKVLTGTPGLLRKDYAADGTLVVKKLERRPKPGGTIVTTLNLDWQAYAEKVLKRHCSRGAFVVIDIQTGEILTMASQPSFNLNDFLPYITSKKYKALQDDPRNPLFGRAFQGAYPPASTFKPVVALTALNRGVVSENSRIYCPAALRIGKHLFKNWSKIPEGDINVKKALARSCNTWFYQIGIKLGGDAFLNMARRLGYGSKTGLPLVGETSGLIPTRGWMKKHYKRRMMDGDIANLSIGQGVMLASPLQIAQAMAGIANGKVLPKLWLVKQIQDVSGQVLVVNAPKRRNFLNVSSRASAIVRKGMRDVVNAEYGTGKRGSLSYTLLCGKTGTAQWGPKRQEKRLAWFAGFFPYKNPRFAFAALYEGKSHEKLSGGRKAAPMIRDFFEHFKKEIKIMIKPAPKAIVIDEDEEQGKKGSPTAIPIEEDADKVLEDDMKVHGGALNRIPSSQSQVVPLEKRRRVEKRKRSKDALRALGAPRQKMTPSWNQVMPLREKHISLRPLQKFRSLHSANKLNRAIPVEE